MNNRILASALSVILAALPAVLGAKSAGKGETAPETPLVSEGQPAPDFTLPDDQGVKVSLKDFRGRFVVLYFYPKDMTPGCTREACDFRDHWKAVRDKGAVVLGVSADTEASHRKFKAKHSLPFPLLSDPAHGTLKKYGVWQSRNILGLKTTGIVRTTVLIGKDGKVLKVWSPVDVQGHVEEILKDL